MTLHFLAPEDKDKWHPTWHTCFNIWSQTPYNLNVWTDEGIDKLLQEDDEEFYNEYLNKIPNIYKFDYVRYIILERYGGMYVDMDIELIDASFIDKLDPKKVYLMEGTCGTYVENSLMLSPLNDFNKTVWQRVKSFAKNSIIKEFKKCKDPYNVIWITGPQLMSKFFIKYLPPGTHPRKYFDILSYEQFSNPYGTLNYTKHWQTSTWNQ